MKEYRIGSAIVRIHGSPNYDKLKAATERYLKKAMQCKKEKERMEK